MTCELCCILATFILIAVMLLVDWQRRLLAMTNVRKICLMLVASKKAFGVNREAYGATADIGAGGSPERASPSFTNKERTMADSVAPEKHLRHSHPPLVLPHRRPL